MQAEMYISSGQTQPLELQLAEGEALISLRLPEAQAIKVAEAIKSVLALAGHDVLHRSKSGEELVNPDDVFGKITPGARMRGLRTKEGLTQVEFAERIGITQNMVSDMESGRRNISLNMARRVAREFGVPYKIFL